MLFFTSAACIKDIRVSPLPGQLERRIGQFVTQYNTRRYHESLNNLTPEDVYRGRVQTILTERQKIKRVTMEYRRRLHRQAQTIQEIAMQFPDQKPNGLQQPGLLSLFGQREVLSGESRLQGWALNHEFVR